MCGIAERKTYILHQTRPCLVSKFASKNNLPYAVEKTKILIKLPAVCFRGKYKNKAKTKKITPTLDWTGFCLFKMSDNLNFVKIEKFKDSVSVSNNQCLKYVCKQCLSEYIIFTVYIGCDCLRGFHEARQERILKQQCCTYIQLLPDILLGIKYCIKVKYK